MDDERSRRSMVFGSVAAAYAEHRPGYPDEAVAWAVEPVRAVVRAHPADASEAGSPRRLLDLAAGTGKLTAALLDMPGASVTAVEPDPAMLAELRARHPSVRALDGRAEAIPLPGASVDAVLVGTAWHWFDPDRALTEIARVLRPGGVLAVLGTHDDPAVEWVTGYNQAAERGRPVRGKPPGAGQDGFALHPAFGPSELAEFRFTTRTTVDGLIATLGTHSWALISEPADRDAAFARIRGYLATRPELAGGTLNLPSVTTVVRAVRRRSPPRYLQPC